MLACDVLCSIYVKYNCAYILTWVKKEVCLILPQHLELTPLPLVCLNFFCWRFLFLSVCAFKYRGVSPELEKWQY